MAFASPPTRQNSYDPNETILSADVSANENAIFNYLQAGVDSYADSSIFNADIAPSANIQSDKLNLTAIAQNIANTGTFNNTGNVTITGNLTVTGSFNVVPSGVIVMWSGSVASIPSGWVICDGTNSTPDLRDRFVIGAGSTYAVAATGGATTINIAHTHTVSGTTGTPSSTTNVDGSSSPVGSGVHTHTFSATSSSGLSAAQSILPPYYALAYIMKS